MFSSSGQALSGHAVCSHHRRPHTLCKHLLPPPKNTDTMFKDPDTMFKGPDLTATSGLALLTRPITATQQQIIACVSGGVDSTRTHRCLRERQSELDTSPECFWGNRSLRYREVLIPLEGLTTLDAFPKEINPLGCKCVPIGDPIRILPPSCIQRGWHIMGCFFCASLLGQVWSYVWVFPEPQL